MSEIDRRTSYPVWVYLDRSDDPLADADVAVRRRFDDRTRELLADGRRVLVVPDGEALRYSLRGSFQPDFWNYELFKGNGNPGTLGIACDPTHRCSSRSRRRATPTDSSGTFSDTLARSSSMTRPQHSSRRSG